MLTKIDREKEFKRMVPHIADVDPQIVQAEKRLAQTSPFRQHFHIEPASGTLGDPNGFSFFAGQYHLFYQWSPLAFHQPALWQHGWYHLASPDLVHWQDLGPGMESDTSYDCHGTYSGSALPVGDRLFLMYTGNTWNRNWVRVPYQIGAWMNANNQVKKNALPYLTGSPAGYTPHFRDPKLWHHGHHYYALLGAQRENLTGTALLYQSTDLTAWRLLGEVQTDTPDFGFMWECPDYFEVDGHGVLLFCPQGLSADGNFFNNVYQNGCFVGEPLNYATRGFHHGAFQELDAGFDFYATQTMQAPDGRRILSGWMGISEIHYPTEQYHYSGCLVIPRELSVHHNQLVQQPIRELTSLRRERQTVNQIGPGTVALPYTGQVSQEFDLTVSLAATQTVTLDFRADVLNQHHTRLTLDRGRQLCTLDRSQAGLSFAEQWGTVRHRRTPLGERVRVHVFVDTSSIEIFIGDGATVFTSRIFPAANQTQTFVTSSDGQAQVIGSIWNLA